MRKLLILVAAVMGLCGCGGALNSSEVKRELTKISAAYDVGLISKQENLDQGIAVLTGHASSPEDYEAIAYFQMIGARWVRDEISKEEANYLIMVKWNELQQRRANRIAGGLNALGQGFRDAGQAMQPAYSPQTYPQTTIINRPDGGRPVICITQPMGNTTTVNCR